MKDDKNNKDINAEELTNTEQQENEVVEEFIPEDEEGNPAGLIKKLREKIKKLEGEKQEYLDGWQRSRADYANFKKQNEDEKKAFVAFANRNLITEIIPVLESFDMAMGNKAAWEQVPANWRVGVEYIAQQLHSVLENQGVQIISPKIGDDFDLKKHEAVTHIPTSKKEEDGKIVSVSKKGYVYKDIVLVPAKVNVGEFKEEK